MPDPVTRSAARLALLIALPAALVAGLLMFWGLGGFGRGAPAANSSAPVAMPGRSLPATAATMCLAFVAHLPPSIRGLAERPVTAGPEQNAAYGDPAITVGCGGWPAPPTTASSPLWTLSDTCWYADQRRRDVTTWITLDRVVPIQVTLPNSYQGQGGWVQEFIPTIRAWVPATSPLPAQCHPPSTGPS